MRLTDDHVTFAWEEGLVSAMSPWFSVNFAEPLPPPWIERAAALAGDGSGSVTLQTESGTVTVTLVMAKRDELNVSIRLQQPPDLLHDIRLSFTTSQAALPTLFE